MNPLLPVVIALAVVAAVFLAGWVDALRAWRRAEARYRRADGRFEAADARYRRADRDGPL